jgi:hypothetical protein
MLKTGAISIAWFLTSISTRYRAGVRMTPEYPFCGRREVEREIRAPLVDVDQMLLGFGDTKKTAHRS